MLQFEFICVVMPRSKRAIKALERKLMFDYLSGLFTANDNCETLVCAEYIATFHAQSKDIKNPVFTVYSLTPEYVQRLEQEYPDPKGGHKSCKSGSICTVKPL